MGNGSGKSKSFENNNNVISYFYLIRPLLRLNNALGQWQLHRWIAIGANEYGMSMILILSILFFHRAYKYIIAGEFGFRSEKSCTNFSRGSFARKQYPNQMIDDIHTDAEDDLLMLTFKMTTTESAMENMAFHSD